MPHRQKAGQGGPRTDNHDLIRDLADAGDFRVTHHDEQALPGSSICSELVNQTNSFCWARSRSTVATALLALLATTAPLKAQTSRNALVGLQEQGVSAELGNDQTHRTPGIEVSPDSRAPSLDGFVAHTESRPLRPSEVFAKSCAPSSLCLPSFSDLGVSRQIVDEQPNPDTQTDKTNLASNLPVKAAHPPKPADFNRDIYYKNKLEFGLDAGYLPINIPFVFDFLLGDDYNKTPLRYTLVPVIASVRWQMDDIAGPWILRGNWDLTCSSAVVAIPRGPETRYFSWIMGIRRNFVPRNWKVAPYFDGRLGLGDIDAKGPRGVVWSQGQNFTFTVNLGSGVRYNFSPRYAISAGLNWMHISNLYLSQPAFPNYGINVYGPMFGIDVRIGKPHHHASE